MKVEKISRKSHYYNEDRFVVSNNFCMVLDGATALQKSNFFKPTEASWFVSFIKSSLQRKTDNVLNKLSEISKQAHLNFNEILFQNDVGINELSYYPSAGLSFAEIHGDKVEICTIGDCEAVVKLKSGKTFRIMQPQLSELDEQALKTMIELKQTRHLKMKDAVKACADVLLENRKLMNTPSGYSVYTLSQTGEFNYLRERFNIEEIDEIYLYTDGVSQAFNELKIYPSWKEMFEKSVDIREEVEKIVKKAFSDKECEKYPRFKIIDDVTMLKITF